MRILFPFLGMQFEPEPFVDSLLGIGIAGGGASKNEGKALEKRLTQMRNERNERAKTAAATKKETAPSPSGGGSAGQMSLQGLDSIGDMDMGDDMGEMEMITPGGGGGGGGGGTKKAKKKSNIKKKKKKKGKR